MVVAVRLIVATGTVATFIAWSTGLSWIWPWLAMPTCLAFIVTALLDDGEAPSGDQQTPSGRRRAACAPSRPGVTDNHGHAAWMTMKEALRVFPGPAAGYYVAA